MTKYEPFIYKIPSINVDDIYKDNSVMHSININQPLISLGFHSFIHRTKSAMDITKKLETKNEFYNIVNTFENVINDYNEDINNISQTYFALKKNETILSRDFYKMWEILNMFNIADNKHINLIGLNDMHGSFTQAFIKYREKFHTISKDNISYVSHNNINSNYSKIVNNIKITDSSILDVDTIHQIKSSLKEQRGDLIIADGSMTWNNDNYMEQEAYILIYSEILAAISLQAKDGNFVLKIFETFTHVTIKLIYLLSSFYDEVILYKPYFSRETNSERYLICRKFKSVSDLDKKIKILEKTLISMKSNIFIIDVFPQFNVYDVNIFKYINILLVNTQQIMVNLIVQYIKSNNYFSENYHAYHSKQIESTKWWISTYFVNKLIDFSKTIKNKLQYNESELNIFVNKIL